MRNCGTAEEAAGDRAFILYYSFTVSQDKEMTMNIVYHENFIYVKLNKTSVSRALNLSGVVATELPGRHGQWLNAPSGSTD
ncbi:hypothetical protein AGMMS49960_04220 [Betaproteobacteria bacterium]|nr:hypothetical protein AGMMS49960_04220 [Betaproteobacteria bacterium]GHU23941.1 hypothetical protein AGMMS50243_26250 [Betaproteobacteria bacterium]